jgi:hypothetical protein
MVPSLAIANVLPDFVAGVDVAVSVCAAPARDMAIGQMEGRIAAAHKLGVAEGRALASAEAEAIMDGFRAAAELDLGRCRAAWASEEAELLASQLHRGLQDLEQAIARPLGELLASLLHAKLHCELLHDIVQRILRTRGRALEIAIDITCAPDFQLQLRPHLEANGIRANFHAGQGSEIAISVDQTLIQVDVEAWRQRVEEALA